jgi:hypothetical protein
MRFTADRIALKNLILVDIGEANICRCCSRGQRFRARARCTSSNRTLARGSRIPIPGRQRLLADEFYTSQYDYDQYIHACDQGGFVRPRAASKTIYTLESETEQGPRSERRFLHCIEYKN